jgi:hypothetical protein
MPEELYEVDEKAPALNLAAKQFSSMFPTGPSVTEVPWGDIVVGDQFLAMTKNGIEVGDGEQGLGEAPEIQLIP